MKSSAVRIGLSFLFLFAVIFFFHSSSFMDSDLTETESKLSPVLILVSFCFYSPRQFFVFFFPPAAVRPRLSRVPGFAARTGR